MAHATRTRASLEYHVVIRLSSEGERGRVGMYCVPVAGSEVVVGDYYVRERDTRGERRCYRVGGY